RAAGIILLVEAGRALSARDVADVTGVRVVAEIPIQAGVARTIDAGLLLSRFDHHTAFRALARLADDCFGPDPAIARPSLPTISVAQPLPAATVVSSSSPASACPPLDRADPACSTVLTPSSDANATRTAAACPTRVSASTDY